MADYFLHMPVEQALAELRPIGEEIVVSALQEELGSIGVYFDRWFREQSLYDDGLAYQILDQLRAQGDIGEQDGAIWFHAHNYRKKPRTRSSSAPAAHIPTSPPTSPTTTTSSCAVALTMSLTSGQSTTRATVPRMAPVMQALHLDPGRLTLLIYGLVKLVRDGQEVKLSKRKGNLLTIADVLDEVGADAVRFNLLTRGPESTIEFDLDLAVHSPMTTRSFTPSTAMPESVRFWSRPPSRAFCPKRAQQPTARLLEHPSELALVRKLLELEEQVELAVEKMSPHNLTHYAVELARIFNGFYRDCHVVDPANPSLTHARLLLSRAAQTGLVKTLRLIGVSAPETM